MLKPFDPISVIKSRDLIGDELSPAQETLLRCLYGLPLNATQRAIFSTATGIASYTPREFREALVICGRKSGKSSKVAANCAVIEAVFREHKLAPGERGHVVVIAPTKRQARVCFGYILARLQGSPTLRAMILGDPRDDEVDLINNVTITVMVASVRTVRGFSCVCVILDEEAFFFDSETNVNPCGEILKALRPSMATFENAKLVRISSPFARSGNLFESWQNRARHPEVLAWKLETRLMNPSLGAFLDREERRDPESFAREYGAEFVDSAAAFLPAEAVEACVVRDRVSLVAAPTAHPHVAAIDFGFRRDRTALTIVHKLGDRVIQDYTTSWRPTKAEPVELLEVIADVTQILKNYAAICSTATRSAGSRSASCSARRGSNMSRRTRLAAGQLPCGRHSTISCCREKSNCSTMRKRRRSSRGCR